MGTFPLLFHPWKAATPPRHERSRGRPPAGRAAPPRPRASRGASRLVALAVCLFCLALPALAAAAPAAFTYPTDGATAVDPSIPFAWTTSSDGQGYYLTVGSTAGARDVVDTGQISTTSYGVSALPVNTPLYARIYTLIAGTWVYSDAGFTATAPAQASFLYPVNGQAGVTLATPFSWTAVPGAGGYYLTIGTTSSGRDVLDSGGPLSATTYDVESMPIGQTLYATIYALVNGTWIPNQITFTAAAIGAQFTYPLPGENDVTPMKPFAWTAVPGAGGYYLTIGTTSEGRDVVDSGGPLSATTYDVDSMPTGQTLYATVYALINGTWCPTQITFTAAAIGAQFSNPLPGATGVYQKNPFAWSAVDGAGGYYLTIGTTAGARDLLDVGGLSSTSYAVSGLPASTTLFATVYTELCGFWYPSSISFTTGAPLTTKDYAPTFTFPSDGAVGVDTSHAFTWAPVPIADVYYLTVGTTPRGRDVIDTGSLSSASTSYFGGTLPQEVLYATIYSEVLGAWYSSTVSFTPGPPPTIATFVSPVNGATGVDMYQGFSWNPVAASEAYYLVVGSKPGARDLFNLMIHLGGSNTRFVPSLQPNQTYYATIYTRLNGNWFPSSLSFTTGADTGVEFSDNQAAVFSLVDGVRAMADVNGLPSPGTTLYDVVAQAGGVAASCEEYAWTLLQEMATVKIRNAQNLQIAFINDGFDSHDLVQVYSSAQQQWVLLDPTFDLIPKRASDGLLATVDDLNQATLAQAWGAITYTFLSAKQGSSYAHNYYLDYPLLYLNILGVSTSQPDITPYLVQVGPSTSKFGPYLVSTAGTGAVVEIDGGFHGEGPTEAGAFSGFFEGTNISVVCPSSTLYAPHRYVF